MPTQIYRSEDGTNVFVIHEPGNMTRYVGSAQKITNGPVGFKGDWVVSFPLFGSSYIIPEGAYLGLGYLLEKFAGRSGRAPRLQAVDMSELGKVIAMMVPDVSCESYTDDTGHLLPDKTPPVVTD